MNNGSNIWCTLVMLGDSYARGAAVAAQSLKDVGSVYPSWCMVTNDVSKDCVKMLNDIFDNVIEVPFIKHEVAPMKSQKQNQIYGNWIHASFTKWNIYNPKLFPGVDKLCFIDADMIFTKNCDDLFELEPPAMTFSSPWMRPYAANGYYNPYGELQHGACVSKIAIRRGLECSSVGIANMVLVRPIDRHYNVMMDILSAKKIYGCSKCISGFDEQLLAEIILACDNKITHIHQSYNWYTGKTNWLLHNEEPKTLQYYGGKPWDGISTEADRANIENAPYEDLKIWWRIADRIITKYPSARKIYYPGNTTV